MSPNSLTGRAERMLKTNGHITKILLTRIFFFRQGNSNVHVPMGGVATSGDRLWVVGPIALVRPYCTYGFFSSPCMSSISMRISGAVS